MKKTYILIALAMVAALSMVSCKNNNKKTQEPTQEEVQEQKQALADTVLAKIDELAAQYINVTDKADFLAAITLTDEEKMVKPDYLLDPSEASNFVTKEQKTNALAVYVMESYVRSLYDMPTDDVKEVIAKLALDLNHPVDADFSTSDKLNSELIREEYNACKERGDLAYFWQFENAILRETDYIVTQNPELLFNKIGEDIYNAMNEQWHNFFRAIWALAPYDEEINQLYQTLECTTDAEYESTLIDFTLAIEFCNKNKEHFADLRNALLK